MVDTLLSILVYVHYENIIRNVTLCTNDGQLTYGIERVLAYPSSLP